MANSDAGQYQEKTPEQRTPHLQLSEIANEELHQAAFASLNIGVWKYDLLRRKMSWGPEVETILGARPSSSPEETFFGLMHPDEFPQLMAQFQKCLVDKQAFRLDLRIKSVDGRLRWMNATGQPYFDSEGRPSHMIGTVRDITDQKLSQQWLQAYSDVLRSIAMDVPLPDVFQAIVEMLQKGLDVSMVALLKLDQHRRLKLEAGVNVPEDYAEAIESVHVDTHRCLCSTTILAAEPMYSDHLRTDTRLGALSAIIERHSWGSGCTYPILLAPTEPTSCSGRPQTTDVNPKPQVAGLFAIYRSPTGVPSEKELDKISQAAHLANIVLERDQTHQSLRESEHRFRELANAMPQLVWTANAQGECNYGNRLLKETIGEDGLRDWLSVVHPDDRQTTMQRYAEAIRTGQPYTVEQRLLLQGTQTYHWFLARSLPSFDADGKLAIWYGAATDIDYLKRTEAALRDERDRLTAIAATCPSVLFTFMELPDGTPTLPYAAPALGELLGVDQKEICRDARCLTDRIDDEDGRRLHELLRSAAEAMSSIETTFRIHHPRKGIVWLECQASPCRLADGQVCWHGTLTDVTRRKMLEARLMQSEKLEAIGRLAGGVAHDFNNMLTVIISACHVLESQLQGQAYERENIDAIRQSALRAALLTKQLLAFSRQQPAQPQQLNINALITQADGILERMVGQAITLSTELADDLKLVFVDPSQVEQILINLVINSRDAIATSGRIEIVTSNTTRSCPQHPEAKEYVQISVSDNGCGMCTETLKHIFEPFFTTKAIGKGTGLGLAVVHGIVTQNDGLIEVESMVDQGTTFKILLPAIESHSVTAPIQRAVGLLEGGSEGVLVVDDEVAIGTMTSKTLRALGYSVFTATSPEEALRVFEKECKSIDILLTDLLMPSGNGVELAGRLLALKPSLRVIVMSGHRTSSFDHADGALSGYRFLPKPYTTIELSSALRAAIDNRGVMEA